MITCVHVCDTSEVWLTMNTSNYIKDTVIMNVRCFICSDVDMLVSEQLFKGSKMQVKKPRNIDSPKLAKNLPVNSTSLTLSFQVGCQLLCIFNTIKNKGLMHFLGFNYSTEYSTE